MALILIAPPARIAKARASADHLTAAADAAVPRVRRWWGETWAAFQAILPVEWALSSLETVLRQAWHSLSIPRLETLQALLQRLADTVSRTELPPLSVETLGITQAIAAVETSLAQVPTTMARLPQALLPDVAVLTIPQQGVLVRMAEGLAQDLTIPPAHVERTLRTQAKAQLKARVDTLAQQQVWTAAQEGQQAGFKAQRDAGVLPGGVKRYWVLAPSACVERCAPVPGMNAGGVGLDEVFTTPVGSAMSPPLHINCRCSVSLR